MPRNKVLVAGALGVVGSGFLRHASDSGRWDVVGLSRRFPEPHVQEPGADYISVDLLNAEDCLRNFADVTHLVYCAVSELPDLLGGWTDLNNVSANEQMLRNILDAVEISATQLRHVTLLQGTKAYGVHLGAFDIPAKESAPRHPAVNFYHRQEDVLRSRQAYGGWNWTIWRPQTVVGYSRGSPMNMLTTIAVYASVMKALGLPLRFPGTNLLNIWQAVDTRILAKAIEWGATAPAAANQIFNVTNGDCSTWEALWPTVAHSFGMEVAPPQRYPLELVLRDKEGLWNQLVRQHGLQASRLDDLVSWQFAERGFTGGGKNSYVSTIKARQWGFNDCIDTAESFAYWFNELRERRIIPPLLH